MHKDINLIAKEILKNNLSKIKYSYKMLQTPQETQDLKKGDCFEQAELTRFLLTEKNVNCRTYVMEMNRDKTSLLSWKNVILHGFVVFESQHKFFWIERAYCAGKYIGVHEYSSMQELFDDFIQKTICYFENDFKIPTNNIIIREYDEPKYPISYTDHILSCLNSQEVYRNKA